jgi:Protein O-mannosyl-transferase TMEM260-like
LNTIPNITTDDGASEARHQPFVSPSTAWMIATVVAAVLYITTMAPGVSWGDSGNAQVRVLNGLRWDRVDLSRSHVLYYIVGSFIADLGVDAAYLANLISALAGAVTVGNIAALAAVLKLRRTAVACAALMLMLSHALWHLSSVAEVMTFSTMLLTTEFLLIAKFVSARKPPWLIAAMFVNGLGVATHNMSLLMWPAYAVLLWMARRDKPETSWRTLLACGGALAIGASPVIALFFKMIGRRGTAFEVAHELLAGRFAPDVFNIFPSFGRLVKMAAYTAYSFPTPLLFLFTAGAFALWRRASRRFAVFFVVAFAVNFIFAIRYSVPDQHVFLLHSYLFGIIFIAFAIDKILDTRRSVATSAVLIALAMPAPLVYAVVPDLLKARFPHLVPLPVRTVRYREPFRWFLKPWRRGDDGAERFAREVLNDLPYDAVLVIDSTLMPPILYLQGAQGLRRDVHIVGARSFQLWFDGPVSISEDMIAGFVKEGRMCTVSNEPRYLNPKITTERYKLEPLGHAYRMVFADKSEP